MLEALGTFVGHGSGGEEEGEYQPTIKFLFTVHTLYNDPKSGVFKTKNPMSDKHRLPRNRL